MTSRNSVHDNFCGVPELEPYLLAKTRKLSSTSGRRPFNYLDEYVIFFSK